MVPVKLTRPLGALKADAYHWTFGQRLPMPNPFAAVPAREMSPCELVMLSSNMMATP